MAFKQFTHNKFPYGRLYIMSKIFERDLWDGFGYRGLERKVGFHSPHALLRWRYDTVTLFNLFKNVNN